MAMSNIKQIYSLCIWQGLSKMRHNMKSGHPESFKAFLRDRNIPQSKFPRYVGNRLHIKFHLAGVFFEFSDVLLDFLKNYCRWFFVFFSLHILNQQLYKAVQKQAIKKTRETEKEVSPFIEKGENMTTDDIEEKYQDIEPNVANRASQMCRRVMWPESYTCMKYYL